MLVEVKWLGHVCRVLNKTHTSRVSPYATLLHLITEETSTFYEAWAGEVYPGMVQRVLDVLPNEDENAS